MRTILLVTDFQPGGTPLRLARLAVGLRARGVDVHAGCLAAGGPVLNDLAAQGVPVFNCGARGPRSVGALWRLAKHIRRIAPDLVHASLMHANVAARIAGTLLRVPVIGSTATIECERPWHLRLERWTAGLDRVHLANSRAVAACVRQRFGLPEGRVAVLPPAVRPLAQVDASIARAALGVPADHFVVAWVGRLDPVKRLDLLVSAAEDLADLPVTFLVAGDGPERVALARRLDGSVTGARVRLLGWQNEVALVLSAANAFMFPSLTEGLPNAVLEAMGCGLPIVGSDIPALREIAGLAAGGPLPNAGRECEPPSVGRLWLVPGDRAADYAGALRALYQQPEVGRVLGERAAAWVRAHACPDAQVEAVLRVYERVLGVSRGAGAGGPA